MAGAKRRRRAGRPRRANPEEKPRKQKDEGPPPHVLAQRYILMKGAVQAYPGAFAGPLAMDPDAAWLIGRLYLVRQLSREQRDAGEKLARAARAYERVLLAPRRPDSTHLLEPSGVSTESDQAHMKRFRRAKRNYDRLYEALADAGREALRAVSKALADEQPNLEHLRKGLNALAKS